MTKVVDRRWYGRNKHIFPASVWTLYMTSYPPSDSRHFQDNLSKSSGNSPQQIRPSLDPEYILPGTKIGSIHGQNGTGAGARAIHSF